MSESKYSAGVRQGVLLSQQPGEWPAEVPGLGAVAWTKFGLCEDCREHVAAGRDPQAGINGGYATYGGRHLCRFHAQKRAAIAA